MRTHKDPVNFSHSHTEDPCLLTHFCSHIACAWESIRIQSVGVLTLTHIGSMFVHTMLCTSLTCTWESIRIQSVGLLTFTHIGARFVHTLLFTSGYVQLAFVYICEKQTKITMFAETSLVYIYIHLPKKLQSCPRMFINFWLLLNSVQ